jgi:hypothetical protein
MHCRESLTIQSSSDRVVEPDQCLWIELEFSRIALSPGHNLTTNKLQKVTSKTGMFQVAYILVLASVMKNHIISSLRTNTVNRMSQKLARIQCSKVCVRDKV